MLKALLALCLFAGVASASEWYVAPKGAPQGDGSAANPWNLQTAFDHPKTVQPGDTIWLKEGAYGSSVMIMCKLNGAEGKPIIVRGERGKRVTVDGGIRAMECTWTTFWGFEIMNSSAVRRESRPPGLEFFKRGGSAINMVIHDTGHPGIGWWINVGGGVELYGNIMWANGFYDASGNWHGQPRGNGFYMQNQEGTRTVSDNIAFRNFTGGFKAYTEGGYAWGFEFLNNVCFDTDDRAIFASGGKNGLARFKAISNCVYRRPDDATSFAAGEFGYTGGNQDGLLQDNYFVSGSRSPALQVKGFKDFTVSGNTFIGPVKFIDMPGNFPDNTLLNARPAAGQKVFVHPNKYEKGRAHVAIFNWDKRETVEVDLAKVLTAGQAYEIRDAQNYYGRPVVTGTYDAKPVAIPMNQTEVAQPVGDCPHIKARFKPTAPEFGAFVVIGAEKD